MTFLYSIPAFVLLLGSIAFAVTLAGLGQTFVHRRFRRSDFLAHNEVGGIIIAVCGTLYAVVLGFLTVVVWQHVVDARQLVVQESNADIDAWHSAVGLPAGVRTHIRNDIIHYAQIMVAREWPAMRRGAYDEGAAMVGMDAIDTAGAFQPANARESNAQAQLMQLLTAMHDARQQRIATNGDGVPWFEWVVLLLGAFCIVSFCWLFGVSNGRVQLVMTSAVVTITVSILVLLFELQYPFRSDIGIQPVAWVNAVAHIHEMQAGEMADMKM
ncbi:MAG TPA: hypothetical protein VHL34_16935 [Rhizomicrobium sp.]|jgi:hypothetical protein|nr:hypothetical protein [Rhizomicrobium sp.]